MSHFEFLPCKSSIFKEFKNCAYNSNNLTSLQKVSKMLISLYKKGRGLSAKHYTPFFLCRPCFQLGRLFLCDEVSNKIRE